MEVLKSLLATPTCRTGTTMCQIALHVGQLAHLIAAAARRLQALPWSFPVVSVPQETVTPFTRHDGYVKPDIDIRSRMCGWVASEDNHSLETAAVAAGLVYSAPTLSTPR